MQISKTENVIFLREVESNIIQEAFVILKDNVKFEFDEKKTSNLKKSNSEMCILKEAENLINCEINACNFKYEKFKMLKLERKLKIQKTFNIFCVIALLISIIIK